MSDTTTKYENAIAKLQFSENQNDDFSLIQYSSERLQQKLISELELGESYIPEIQMTGAEFSNDINTQTPSDLLEDVARESLFSTVGVYLEQNDKVLKEVFSPYSSQIRNGSMTYGQAVTQAVNGGYSSTYGTALGVTAKTLIGLSIGVELAGSAIEIQQSQTPLNEIGKQAWGVAGGLTGGALGVTAVSAAGVLLATAGVVVSAPTLLVASGLVSAAGWYGGEKYMEYAYDNLLPAFVEGAFTLAEIAGMAFDNAQDFVDDLWDETGENAANFFDLLAEGAGDVGEDFVELRDDYSWAIDQVLDSLPDWAQGLLDEQDRAETIVDRRGGFGDPLVLDLDGNGIELSDADGTNAVFWDIDVDGFNERSGWIANGDGLLAIDSNNDGIINDSSELFGDQTGFENGFLALTAFDSNNDSSITSADADFSNLLVWVDDNNDAVSQSAELYSLNQLGITSIDLNYAEVDYEIANNPVLQESTFVMNGQTRTIVDAYFAFSNINTKFNDTNNDYTLDIRTLFLPTLRGFGNLPDLHIAMSQDEVLLNMVQDFSVQDANSLFNSEYNLEQKMTDILYQWAGVQDNDPTGRGVNIDARTLEFFEKFTGEEWNNGQNPGRGASAAIIDNFESAWSIMASQMMAQTEARSVLGTNASYNLVTGEIEGVDHIDRLHISTSENETLSNGRPNENDLYIYNLGDGVDSISENGGADKIIFGAGIVHEDIRVVSDAGQLILHIGEGSIRINNQYRFSTGGESYEEINQIEMLQFEDGSEYSLIDNVIFKASDVYDSLDGLYWSDDILIGNNSDNSIRGYSGNDTIEGGKGKDYLNGGEGDDLYIYNLGDGVDSISENGGADKIIFGAGIVHEDIRVVSDAGQLILHIGEGSIRINNQYRFSTGGESYEEINQIEMLQFEDGSEYSLIDNVIFKASDVYDSLDGLYWSDDILIGNNSDNSIRGYSGNDTIEGGKGKDYLNGGEGDDLYIYNLGDGVDSISENGGADKIIFGAGIVHEDIRVVSDAGQLILHIGEGSIRINNQYRFSTGGESYEEINQIEMLQFEDGSEYSLIDNVIFKASDVYDSLDGLYWSDDILIGNNSDNSIRGYSGNDTIEGGKGKDYLNGGEGDDIAQYNGIFVDYTIAEQSSSIRVTDNNIADSDEGTDTLYSIEKLQFSDGIYDVATGIFTAGDAGVVLPSGDLAFSLEGGVTQDAIADSNVINIGSYLAKTHAMAFETGADVNSQQVIYEQGGATRGLNLFVENNKLYSAVWNKAEENWGYKQLETAIAANTKYTALLVLDGALPSNGQASLYLNGEQVDIINGVGKLYAHGDDIGVGQVQGTTVTNNATQSGSLKFQGYIETIAHYNSVLDAEEFTQLNNYLSNDWLGDDPTPVSQNPIAQNDNFVGDEDEIISGNVLADNGNGVDSDPDGDALTVTAQTITTSQGASVVIQSNGNFTYTPETDFFGNDNFIYSVSDNSGGSDTGLVDIVINEVVDPILDNDVLIFKGSDFTSYNGTQDKTGGVSVNGNGTELSFSGNTWKKMALDYTVTDDTFITFDYKSTIQGEIQGFALETDDNFKTGDKTLQLYGVDGGGTYMDKESFSYNGSGDWQSFTIKASDYFSGSYTHLAFINDHDNGAQNGNSFYRDFKIFEQGATSNVEAPTNNLGLLLEDIADQKEIADSDLVNTISTSTKTHSIAFETGSDINSTQIIYEQGGGSRGLNMFVENGKLHAAVWNKAEENWGYKELDVSVATNTKYTATLVMDGALPSNGTADLYLNGIKVDSVSGVGKLYSHGGDIGIDQTNDDTVINNIKTTSSHSFTGTVQTIAHYNAALSGSDLDQLHNFMAQDWLSDAPSEQVVMEFGSINATNNAVTVDLDHSFENPVVFATMTSFNNAQLAVPRITAIKNDSFTLYAQEADYLDGSHANETFSYIVVEKGSWELSDGTILEVGTIDTNKLSKNGFENILFDHDFVNRPAIFSQVQTNNDGAFVATRQDDGTQDGFKLALQEEEISNTGSHGAETIGWLAIDQGIGSDDGHDFIAGSTGDSFTHAWDDILFNDALDEIPQVIANISSNDGSDASFIRVDDLSQNGAKVSIQEDQSRDSEVGHTTETIDFFAIEGNGLLTAKINPDVI